jgi:hypothetical protein
MTIGQAKQAFAVLELRERLIVKLAVLAGMRCSEIFGLRRGRIKGDHLDVVARVCKRDIDTPKTQKAERQAALSSGVRPDLELWLRVSTDTGPDGWLFPSERLTTPMDADNVMERNIRPKLKEIGLAWVDFRAMRRTHSSLMNKKGIDPNEFCVNVPSLPATKGIFPSDGRIGQQAQEGHLRNATKAQPASFSVKPILCSGVLDMTRPCGRQPNINVRDLHLFRGRLERNASFTSSSANANSMSRPEMFTSLRLGLPNRGRRHV